MNRRNTSRAGTPTPDGPGVANLMFRNGPPTYISLTGEIKDDVTDSSDSSYVDEGEELSSGSTTTDNDDAEDGEEGTNDDDDDEAADQTCRICREEGSSTVDESNPNPLIAPCSCRGTMKWVHQECWRDICQQRCIPCGTNVPPQTEDDDGVLHLDISNVLDRILPLMLANGSQGVRPQQDSATGVLSLFTTIAQTVERVVHETVTSRLSLMTVVARLLDSTMVKAFLCFLMIYTAMSLSLHLLLVMRMTLRVLFTSGAA